MTKGNVSTPCFICRQFMTELFDLDKEVVKQEVETETATETEAVAE